MADALDGGELAGERGGDGCVPQLDDLELVLLLLQLLDQLLQMLRLGQVVAWGWELVARRPTFLFFLAVWVSSPYSPALNNTTSTQ